MQAGNCFSRPEVYTVHLQNKRYCVFCRQLSHGRKRHEKTDTRYAAVSGHAGLDSGAHQPADGDEHPRRHGSARRHRYGAYPDTNTYPTKFIYGQIAATGGRNAICCDPEHHGVHNLPKVVDIYNALTQLPKPEVSAADFLVFDDKSLSDQNNGDGVIDAGETVALAFTLRNRWGAAKDVTLSLDAKC